MHGFDDARRYSMASAWKHLTMTLLNNEYLSAASSRRLAILPALLLALFLFTTAGAAQEVRPNGDASVVATTDASGDFEVGDRIVMVVAGDPVLSDTFMVREGRVLDLPNLPPISVRGVRRADLQAHLTREIGRYIRNPDVRAHSLVRVAVLGGVSRPGFYAVSSDLMVTDLIMYAGGPGGNADIRRTTVRREGREVLDRRRMQSAMAEGRTLNDLNVRPGDELVVGEKRANNVYMYARAAGAILGLGLTIWRLSR